ncbi:hypothetical protein AAVH_41926 [Aphelenchoides avenae]|nr:hypothetical protein AAVH_41926 [Aphelenchus avenae]
MRQIVRNKGFRTKLTYNVDESILKCDEEGLTAYYRTFNALRGEPELLARNAVDYFSECVFRFTQSLYELKLDETELVAFLMLQLFRYAAKKFDVQEPARGLANEILLGLAEHYRTTYDDVSLRMATVVLLLNESENCAYRKEEHDVMLRLMSQEPVADLFEPMTHAISPRAHPESPKRRKYYFGSICIDGY